MKSNNPYEAPKGNLQQDNENFAQVKIFSTKGRLGRLRYVAYAFALMFIAQIIVVVGTSSTTYATNAGSATSGLVFVIFAFAAVLGLMLGIQRCHDLDKSGWLILVSLIPIINFFFTLYLIFAPGTEGENRFGASPPPNTLAVKILASIFPAIFFLGIIAAIAIPTYIDYVNRAKQSQSVN
ncbi:DUF805 domain-containing protein [Pseudomonadota bacterium]